MGNTIIGRIFQKLFPNVDFEMHHIFVRQSWSRVGAPNQIYDDLLANRGLQRLGNGLWNLLPIPKGLHGMLHGPAGDALFATVFYGLVTFGIEEADEFISDIFLDN